MAATPGAIYTGLAQDTTGGSTYLYAANSTGNIHVFNSSWTDVTGSTFAGKFVDPSPVSGFVPFNIQTVGSNLYVTYAQLTAMGTPLPGGYVDEFDAGGNFIKRIATGGPLSAPWGITLAPANFGSFSNDLLIGKPVILAATAGTARHALVVDDQMRSLFAYLRTLPVPTSLFAAPEDWADDSLNKRIDRAAFELVLLMESGFARKVRDESWQNYQHELGSAGGTELGINVDSDLMRLATGGSAS